MTQTNRRANTGDSERRTNSYNQDKCRNAAQQTQAKDRTRLKSNDNTWEDIADQFGHNSWIVEEEYEKYKTSPANVTDEWARYFAQQTEPHKATTTGHTKANGAAGHSAANTKQAADDQTNPALAANNLTKANMSENTAKEQTIPNTEDRGREEDQTPEEEHTPHTPQRSTTLRTPQPKEEPDATMSTQGPTPLKGMALRVAENMETSLNLPVATSVRTINVKLLEETRQEINAHQTKHKKNKISYTHLIGWALIQALKEHPGLNAHYTTINGKGAIEHHEQINLGIAIDLKTKTGERQLVVPNVKNAQNMTFAQWVAAFDQLISKARDGKLELTDYTNTSATLTNPGGSGTRHSVPRLMQGQGLILGVGSIDYSSEWQGSSEETLRENAISRSVTLTSTYDHRIIQGAASGAFLRTIDEELTGKDRYYQDIYESLGIQHPPLQWARDIKENVQETSKDMRVAQLIDAYRRLGHLNATTNPLGKSRHDNQTELHTHGLTMWDLERSWTVQIGTKTQRRTLRQIIEELRTAYCTNTSVEYAHIKDADKRVWIRDKFENEPEPLQEDEARHILEKLGQAETFETFLNSKYVGQKRFSLEGSESLIVLTDAILRNGAANGVAHSFIGMPHRGRLNILVNIAGKKAEAIFDEFEETVEHEEANLTGDVKYHLGQSTTYTDALSSKQVQVSVAANPSHLEAVNAVVEGIVRAEQDQLEGPDKKAILPILMHGDAAFAGQGVVVETMQMSRLEGYTTQGTIHIIVNNQVGFTTDTADARSSTWASDTALFLNVPILHVNGDDSGAVARIGKLAIEWRNKWGDDIIIDLITCRKRGHNEADDPSLTQPKMYEKINKKASTKQIWEEILRHDGINIEQVEANIDKYVRNLETAWNKRRAGRTTEAQHTTPTEDRAEKHHSTEKQQTLKPITKDQIRHILNSHNHVKESINIHPRVKAVLDKRETMLIDNTLDWASCETIAIGTLLEAGINVRLAGQDVRRGTFSQRHIGLTDQESGKTILPLDTQDTNRGRLWVYNSLLSEYAAMGYEYGYSTQTRNTLTMWEAQFGDFANGGQTIIDEYISSGEHKWGQASSLVLLLPHGYEGQGPDHSSARIERFLQLHAQDNMRIAIPSTGANYLHLLRDQARLVEQKPLVIFTPKSMLRNKDATSNIDSITDGAWQRLIEEETGDRETIREVLICSGKIYYDLKNRRDKVGRNDVTIVRLEQIAPLPIEELREALAHYPQARVRWVQEEPANQGPWSHLHTNLPDDVRRRIVEAIARPSIAATAVGSHHAHDNEHEQLMSQALS